MKKSVALSLASAALVLGAIGTAGTASAADMKDMSKMEKCYGVAKAGKNDCKSMTGKHSCAGQASVGGAGDEMVSLPKGTCDKLEGGSLEPKTS